MEIKYRDDECSECVLITHKKHLWCDPVGAAREIAADEYAQAGGFDLSEWPRVYEVFLGHCWHKVSVEIQSKPEFIGAIVE
tara:strand:+ start:216 stop:458 length:243 start_codon:yes stop_codon:yes gene_type:complete